jgi:heterodisulfide reductase subunit B
MGRNLGILEIKLFKFDHSVDYLPYYRSYKIEYTNNESVYDILNKINECESFSYDTLDKCNVKVNNYFLSADVLVTDIVERIGLELTIEPISLYRAKNDLMINSDDYTEKLKLFSKYLTNEQETEFQEKYKLEYYASNTMIVNKDYIGDHSLLIANEILLNNPTLEKEVLEIITNKDTGILYHTSLKNRLFKDIYDVESVYKNLVSKIKSYKNVTLEENEKSEVPEDIEISQYFKGFNIALYNKEGCLFRKIIKKSRATYINLDSRRNDLATNSMLVNEDFTFRIAGEILLEAKDKNADFLIVKDKKDLDIFDAKQSKIARAVNREINLPVITQEQFTLLIKGEKSSTKLGFNNHKIKVSFLEN